MKTLTKAPIHKNIQTCFALIIIAFYVSACTQPKAIPPQAEITKIYNITDSSATVDVQVTKQSNADNIEIFSLKVDTISNGGKLVFLQEFIFGSYVHSLSNNYTAHISNLKSKTQYSLSLFFDGEFDVDAPEEFYGFTVGTTKTFETN